MLNIQNRQEGTASIVTIQGKVNFEVTAQLRDVIRDTVTTPAAEVAGHQP